MGVVALGDDRLVRVAAALAASDDGSGPLISRLCPAAVELAEVSGAAVSILSEDRYSATVCVSDDVAAQLEELHVALGDGPGLDAHRSGQPVVEADLAEASPDRWPSFTQSALEAGARAVFAFPLRIGGIRVGILDLYRATPGPLSATGFGDAVTLAHLGAQAVVALSAQAPPDGDPGVLTDAALRAEVHQATGMISVQLDVGIEEAFVRLQAHAYATGRRIGEVGDDVVARRLRFDEHT
jgi:GAF domain-containing protein